MSTCSHVWVRRPDLDGGRDFLGYVCSSCDCRGRRRFGSDPSDVRTLTDRGRLRARETAEFNRLVRLEEDEARARQVEARQEREQVAAFQARLRG